MESPLPPNNASQSSNTGLIAGIITMAVVIILLTLVLVIVVSTKLKQFQKNEAAYNSISVYYDYPTMNIQSINVKKNKAYAANDNIETNPNEAYAIMMNTISTVERNNT